MGRRTTKRGCAGLAWCGALLLGCGEPATDSSSSREGSGARGQSVVFLLLDAAGARHFGTYGNERPTTPNIDALARDAVVFEHAYSQEAWTLPSALSFMTGMYPRPGMGHEALPGLDTIAAKLRDHGLCTAAFSESPFVTRTFNLHLGFETFEEYFPYER